MVKTALDEYVEIVGYFYRNGVTSKDSARRTSVVEEDFPSATNHKLDALFEKGVLNKYQKGDGKAYPIRESSGERISVEKAERVIDSWFAEVVAELRDDPKALSKVKDEVDDFEELAKDAEEGSLPDKVTSSIKILEACDEKNITLETSVSRIEFRNPSNRWFLADAYRELFES